MQPDGNVSAHPSSLLPQISVALASTARRICCSFLDPMSLSAFVARHPVALDNRPGVRPIGIGETARRIIGKAILTTIRNDVQEAAGPLQLCAGQEAGCEAAVRQMFDSPDAEAAILVDYIAMAKGSPCVVPSSEISLLPHQ